MSFTLPPDMLEATRLTRAGRLAEATSLLQRLLGGGATRDKAPTYAAGRLQPPQLDLTANEVEVSAPSQDADPRSCDNAVPPPQASVETNLANVLRDLVGRFGRSDLVSSLQSRFSPASVRSAETVPSGGTFLARSYSNLAGTRPYKLYIPSSYRADGPALPLIVMLHGCTQSPDDFAAGTRMNTVAEEQSA